MLIKNIGTTTMVDVDLGVRVSDVLAGEIVFATDEQGQNLVETYESIFERVDSGNATIQKQITITSAELLALNTTPKTLVSAPGAGKYIVVDNITASLDYVSAAYATNTTMEFRYTNGSGTKVTADIASLLTATADKVQNVKGVEVETTLTANAAVVATVATGNPVTGDSPVKITINYRILSI